MNKEAWNTFVASSPHGSFLQSWQWGEMQEKLGVKIWRIEEEGAVALVLKRPQPLGKSWLYIPRGPVFTSSDAASASPYQGEAPLLTKERSETGEVWQKLEKKLTDIAEQENSIFIRIDPAIQTSPISPWRKAEREVQPGNTLVLDLTKREDELLADMHHKTRYNIRLAQKKGLRIRFSKDVKEIDHFLRLSKDVSERGVFSFHPDAYYQTIIDVLGKDDMAEVALAEFQGETLAAHIIVSFADTVTYMHGASSSQSREVMAPHLLQWETIRRAKEKGFKKYDFFGVAPHSAKASRGTNASHPWAGITRFKLGFGGTREDYIGAHDLVLHDGMYHLFNAARRLRSLVR